MRTTQQMSITLPNEMADAIRTKVRAGEYATESEVIREGLRQEAPRQWGSGDSRPARKLHERQHLP